MLSLLALWLVVFQAQAQRPSIPVDQEPQHRIVLKNDFVRVVDATFPPGYVTLHHAHDVDNVTVTISTGTGSQPGRASFAKGGYSHTVTNSNKAVMRFINVELLKSDRPGSAPAQLPNHTLETENDRARVYRVKVAPGETLKAHSHPAGWLEVIVAGGTPGSPTWHAGGETGSLPAGKEALEIVEVEPK